MDTCRVDENGFAILEALIGSIMAAIGIVGLSVMVSVGQMMVVAQGDEWAGLYLAQQKIEESIGTGFTALVVGNATETVSAGEFGTQAYTRVTTVDCVQAANYTLVVSPCPSPLAKRITVTVTATNAQVDAVSLQTVLTSH
jgi:hypothetical protein